MAKKIVDFYHGETVSNFDKIVNATSFVILKGSQGTKLDSKCKERVKEFEKRKHPYWIYVFLNKGNELEQTKFMVNSYKNIVGSYFVGWVIDIEKGNSEISCLKALEWLEKQGRKCMAYINYSSYSSYSKIVAKKNENIGIWECRYGKNNGKDTSLFYPFHKTTDLGQFTERGKCEGLVGLVDLNKVTGYGKKLSWFTTPKKTTVKKEAPTPIVDDKIMTFKVKVCNKTGANLRTEPGTYSPLCKSAELKNGLKYGEVVSVVALGTARSGTKLWYLIEKNGKRGYVSSKVVQRL